MRKIYGNSLSTRLCRVILEHGWCSPNKVSLQASAQSKEKCVQQMCFPLLTPKSTSLQKSDLYGNCLELPHVPFGIWWQESLFSRSENLAVIKSDTNSEGKDA